MWQRCVGCWSLAVVLLLSHLCTATSWYDPTSNKLSHLSKVTSLHSSFLSFEDTINLEVQIPSSSHLTNLRRRWWALADPNARMDLHAQVSEDQLILGSDSRALYSFLTRNSTLEIPEDTLTFKLVLEAVPELQPLTINGLEALDHEPSDIGDRMVTTKGTAYRKSVVKKNGREVANYSPIGWARIVVFNQTDGNLHFQGSWLVDDEELLGSPATTYHLTTADQLLPALNMPSKNFDSFLKSHDLSGRLDEQVVWRDVDRRDEAGLLSGYKDTDFSFFDELSKLPSRNLFKRSNSDNDTSSTGFSSGQNLAATVGNTTGCPTKREVSLAGLAVDCNFLQQFNTTSTVRLYLIDMMNKASRLYEDAFNLTLGLKDIVIVNSTTCPDTPTTEHPWNYKCDSNSSAMGDRLAAMSKWRSNRSDDGIATWSLMTHCNYGGVVGLSWLGMVCNSGKDYAGTNVIHHTDLDYRVIAHEIGHSFGAVHDCTADTCAQHLDRTSGCCPLSSSTCDAGGKYIMNPSAGEAEDSFSKCTQGNICGAMYRRTTNSTCLRTNTGGLTLYTTNVCGNGIVEDGEECDCGGKEGCKGNTCCDPTTCKLTSGSQCDDQNDECCNNCKFSSSDTLCRSATGPCDYDLYCPGNGTVCPKAKFKKDGQSCSVSGQQNSTTKDLTCISGHCTSRDLQCQVLMGNGARSYDGSTLTAVKACDQDSCQLSCMDPQYGDSMCFTTGQNFIDGTPCQKSGKCSKGQCVGGNPLSNLNPFSNSGNNYWRWIVIAACVVGGFLILSILLMLFRRRMRGKPGAKLQGAYPGPRNNQPPPYGYADNQYPPRAHFFQPPPPGFYAPQPPPPRAGARHW